MSPFDACSPGCTCGLHDPDSISNEPLREAILRITTAPEAERVSSGVIAERCGYMRTQDGRRCGDGTKLMRMLGIYPHPATKNGKRYYTTRKHIRYDDAVTITRAAGLDPVDVGV